MKRNHAFLLSVILLCTLFLPSCAPVKLAKGSGTATVTKPDIKDTNPQTWETYWDDQFKAYGTSVIAPDQTYPEVARQTYQKVQAEFKSTVHKAETKRGIIYGVVAGVLALGAAAIATSGY